MTHSLQAMAIAHIYLMLLYNLLEKMQIKDVSYCLAQLSLWRQNLFSVLFRDMITIPIFFPLLSSRWEFYLPDHNPHIFENRVSHNFIKLLVLNGWKIFPFLLSWSGGPGSRPWRRKYQGVEQVLSQQPVEAWQGRGCKSYTESE